MGLQVIYWRKSIKFQKCGSGQAGSSLSRNRAKLTLESERRNKEITCSPDFYSIIRKGLGSIQ